MTNLQKLRKENNLTQIALQIATGIDQAQLSRYEHGQRMISIGDLVILADYFHTSLDYLMDRTDDPTPYPPKKEKE